jgi:16S rRNA (guanine527-N7)-methyltransferase
MHKLSLPLRQGLDALGLSLDERQQNQLLSYMDLMGKWTRVYNLTAVRDPQEMLTHHLLDSLSVVMPLQRQLEALQAGHFGNSQGGHQDPPVAPRPVTLLDVGSGAGLPGVVIAITCPEVQVTCLDAVAKKVAFIQQAASALKLSNLTGRHARIETVTDRFDIISSRAFASLADFVNGSCQALASGGVWMAMKGKLPEEEMAALPDLAKVFHVEQLQVPGLDAQRCLVWMRG